MEASGRFGTQTPTESPGPTPASSGGTDIEPAPATGPLSSDKGETTIADGVVAKVVGIAAREVAGVWEMGGAPARALGKATERVGIGDQRTQGVNVEVGATQAAADLTLVVEYGESIPRVATEVRENVIRRVEGICGLDVTEVNIAVNDLHFPGDDDPARVE